MILRDYQRKAIDSVLESYDRGVRSGIVNLATGLGKSFLTTSLCQEFNQRYGGKTLFLVDQIELAEQAKRTFLATDPTLRVGIEMNSQHADEYDQVVVACVATLGRKGSQRIGKFKPEDFSIVVADEAHKSVSPIWLRTLHFLGVHPENFEDGKLLVGLTATAYRGDGKSLGFLYDDIFTQYDIRYGMREGWLTDIEWVSVKTNTDITSVKVNAGEFAQGELTKKVDNPVRNAQIVKAYMEHSMDEPAIVFCAGVQHAYKMADLFNQAGITAECVEGGTEKTVRKDWISDYREGRIKVLLNHGVFLTGFDAPETTTIIMARPIRSTLTYTQAIGRGLRPSASAMVDLFLDAEGRRQAIENSDKPACKLIDFEDNVGSHNVCRPPVLFGLNPNAKSKKPKTKLFKEVVEVLDDVKAKAQIDTSKLLDLDDIHIISERKRLKLQAYSVDDVIKSMSILMWLPVSDTDYELLLAKNDKALVVEKNMLDQYELHETDLKSNITTKLQTFTSLQGAIKTADDYVNRVGYDTAYQKNDAAWRNKGVSGKQAAILRNLFKGGCRFGPGRYPDTQQLHVTINGRLLENSGEASTLINERFKKK